VTVAIYPGTFDPAHYGHVDIAQRAAKLFDKLIVGVYDRPQKHLMFSIEERVRMMSEALADVDSITVEPYGGLTVDFMHARGASVMVRGLRVISDFELEYQMALTTRRLASDVETVCLMTSQEYAFLSSSIVKEVALAGGAVADFVPPCVEAALRARVSAGR